MNVYRISNRSNDFQRLIAEEDAIWKRVRFECHPITNWIPPKVRVFDPAKTEGDFLAFASGTICVRDEKLECVRSSFEMAGDILKLEGPDKPFWCLNVLSCVNCVDEEASEWLRDSSSGKRITLKRPVFRRGFLATSSIFKVPQQPGSVYVWDDGNEGFFSEYSENRMTGLRFEPIDLV